MTTKVSVKTPTKTDDVLLTLSTVLDAPKHVAIDGEKYDIYGAQHVGGDKEVSLSTLFRKYIRAEIKLNDEDTTIEDVETAAREVQTIRFEILEEFTTIPRALLEKLPLPSQIQLMNTVGKEMGFASDDASEGASSSFSG